MKLAFSLLLLFYTGSSMSCSLNRPLISLSGPITMLLEELGLLTDKNLKGISLFHPVNNFNGKKYGGGIFLGEKFFQEIGNSIIFYDQSRELNKLFSKKTSKVISINSRGKNPFEVVVDNIRLLESFLDKCTDRIKKLNLLLQKVRDNRSLKNKQLIFFLGKINSNLKPDKIIVNDGAILSFKSMGMKTYKSDFSYVSWSAKKMNTEYKDYQQIGLFDEGNVNRLVVSKVGDRMYNLNFRGVFIPGIRQVHFVDEFLKYKFD